MWEYRGKVVRVVDGDTVDLLVDLGFHVYHQARINLARIDALETGKVMLRAVLPEGTLVLLKTAKGRRPGRWAAELSTDTISNLSDWLLAGGHAKHHP